jgi:subtilisin family serine protease
LARGSLYLIDGATGAVYVTPRQRPRPTQVVPATPIKRPTRLLVLGESLLVLDADEGVLVRWPLPVPTEIDLGQDPATALDALYRALFERRTLPTQRAAWRGSMDETLRQEGVWEGSPSQPLADTLCALNDAVCARGQWRLPPTAATILVPDVPIERVMDLATMDVQELGDGTLGDEVDRRVVTPTFFDYRLGAELWELNANRLTALQKGYGDKRWGPYDAQTIRTRRRGDFPPGLSLTVPTEKQRAMVALPRAFLREDRWLSEIRLISPGFNWVPLEEVDAEGATAQPPPPSPAPSPTPCDMDALRREHEALAEIIHYKLPANIPLGTVKVGVVEKSGIDVQHPAFGGATQAFTYISTPPSPSPPPTTPPVCRPATEDDHATMVAGLIASRAIVEGLAGFASNVLIVPVRSTDDDIGDDLLAAFRDRKARIFNLSFHFKSKLVTNIRQKIRELTNALFVVAAGNDATNKVPICESVAPYPAYPVCEGYRNNVLVVAATNSQGDALIEKQPNPPNPDLPGSNWNDRLVQIAAPGIGYHAPARDNSYAAVRGTSFAAPLVTATAALLYAQAVTDPWLIKQRIIATADQKDNLLTKVFGAGLLNVERAVTTPELAVLVKGATTKRAILQLLPFNPAVPGQQSDVISIKWSGGSRTLPLANVRRLTKGGTGDYRIIFLDDVTDTLVVQEVAVASWPFKYQNVDAAGAPTGPIVSDQLEQYDDYVGPIR